MKKFSLLLACTLACVFAFAQSSRSVRYAGGDISALPLYEQHNSHYKDAYNAKINDLIPWFVNSCGWNMFRVRIFVNPQSKNADGKRDPTVCQDLAYVTALGKRIKEAGAYFMLDFHYSDTWVDATHIQAPAAWKGASDKDMADSVAIYTARVLTSLKEAGAEPDLVQVGNEIMYGLCGIQVHPYDKAGDNWEGYLGLLKAGCNAVRDLCPEAQIIIHTDRPTNSGFNAYYYNKLINGGVDFDIIGLSYYPFWHGYLTADQVAAKSDKNHLVNSVKNLGVMFPDKRIQIVETAYNFQYWPTAGVNTDTRDAWPCSVAGQYDFVKDLVDALDPMDQVDGICYWFPEEAGNGDDTNWSTSKGTVMESWLNRGFWNEQMSSSGHAINKTGTVTGSKTPADVCAPYYLGKFAVGKPNDPSGFSGAEEQNRKCVKTIRNGQIVILRNGETYSVLGTKM